MASTPITRYKYDINYSEIKLRKMGTNLDVTILFNTNSSKDLKVNRKRPILLLIKIKINF